MSLYRLSKRAQRDLDAIGRRIELDDPDAAFRVVAEIGAKCQALAEMPGMGHARNDLSRGLRSSLLGKYVIFFRPEKDGIRVVRVIHGSRVIPSLFR